MDTNKATNPMSEYLLKIQLIITNAEFKNKTEADEYETLDTKLKGDAYVRAIRKDDVFDSYTYDPKLIYQVLEKAGYNTDTIFKMISDPILIPHTYKEILTAIGRRLYIDNYKEENKYYVELTGTPYEKSDEVLLPDEFYNIYASDTSLTRGMPLHEMPEKYQELFINSEFYPEILAKYPDLMYLKYLGSYSIPIEVSRPAKDGELMAVNHNKLSTYNDIYGNITVEDDLLHLFTNVYEKTRTYVYNTLRGNFSSIYANYDSFIRFLTIYLSIGNTLNELSRKATSMLYMNSVAANNYFMLYGLPSSIMEGTNMINFLKKFRLILMDKGTNTVYRVKDLVGYEYTDIYSLIMVKQQIFQDGVPIYTVDEDGVRHPMYKIVFRRSGVADENTSYFKFREEHKEFSLDEITSGDPRWWNGPDVDKMINEMNYTLSNSKYIQLSTHMSMEDVFWQTTILLRGLLDRKQETMYSTISINYSINGSSTMSVFDAVMVLVTLMDWKLVDANGRSLKGEMYLPNGVDHNGYPACLDMLFNGLNDDGSPKELKEGQPFKITAFNFDIRETDKAFYNTIPYMTYIEPGVFLPMLNDVLDMKNNNVGEVLMHSVKNIWKYLRDKLIACKTINEFRQVTDVYSHVFLVDPIRNWYSDMPYNVDAILCDEFNITQNDLSAYKVYFIENNIDFYVSYKEKAYPISIYNILNYDVTSLLLLGDQPFNDAGFVETFFTALDNYQNDKISNDDEHLTETVRLKWKDIIKSKVMLDTGNTNNGPKTMEAMLFRSNPSMYARLIEMKNDENSINMLIRSIIKALESYTNHSLIGLQYKSLGVDEYFKTLKEIISYFKSYMVEYTQDEFVYIFGSIFDNGGNSDMLRLFDQIDHARVRMVPKDSLTMFDVSKWKKHLKMVDDNTMRMYDDAIFRLKGTYGKIKQSGYEIWYDNDEWISTNPLPSLSDDTVVVADFIRSGNTYRIIINKNNVDI